MGPDTQSDANNRREDDASEATVQNAEDHPERSKKALKVERDTCQRKYIQRNRYLMPQRALPTHSFLLKECSANGEKPPKPAPAGVQYSGPQSGANPATQTHSYTQIYMSLHESTYLSTGHNLSLQTHRQ